jgi:hypothetical protein
MCNMVKILKLVGGTGRQTQHVRVIGRVKRIKSKFFSTTLSTVYNIGSITIG